MRTKDSLWLCGIVWAALILAGVGILGLYAWLPADGAGGALESFGPKGFEILWLLEDREAGLRVGDVVVRAGGHSVDEWLSGARRGPEWRSGELVTYEILRDGRAQALQIQLGPIPFTAILSRWWAQFTVSLAMVIVGSYVLVKRTDELMARLLMLFCVTVAVSLWGDAYNFQVPVLPWHGAFRFHLLVEHVAFTLSYASICHFMLVFPSRHPLAERFPRLLPAALYLSNPLTIAVVMAMSRAPSTAVARGNQASLAVVLLQLGLAVAAGVRSLRVTREPISRAQLRWILWGAGVAFAVAIPGYIFPLVLTGHPLIPNPVMMLLTVLIPYVYGVAILRYRLFDIEVIINRTLVYGTLTALLAGLYLLLVRLLTLLIQALLHRQNDTLVVFVAALSLALAFAPLRRRVQAVIDRTFYRTKLDYQRLLPDVSERLATHILPDQLATLLTDELPQRLQASWASLAILDPRGELFLPIGEDDQRSALPIDHPLATFLHRLGQPLLRLQPPSNLPPEAQAFLDLHQIELSIPLIAGSELLGLYNLGLKLSGNVYGHDERRLLHLIGQQAAVAVQNSRLFQAERQQRQLAEALQEAADIVSSTLDLDQVLDRILQQVERVVAGDAFNVMLLQDNLARTVRWRGYDHPGLSLPVDRFPTLSQMMHTGAPIIIPDTTADPNWVPLQGLDPVRSYLSAPILVAGQTAGFLNVGGVLPNRFGPADAQRLEAFAQHAATALQNAQLYEQAQLDITERRRAEQQLKTSLEDKDVLLKEIHHRVKNNLQVISSLLYLQARHAQDPHTFSMFLESQHRVRSMALVHETLYRTEDLARVDFARYVHSLTSHLLQSYSNPSRPIHLSIQVDDVSLGIDLAVPCGLIINELVSNSLKHAFPDGAEGAIDIQLRQAPDGQRTLTVRDNGVGLPQGFSIRSTKTLGLQLVNRLVSQLEGSVELSRERGTTITITFSER